MYYQPEAMLEQYDIEIKQITKGRGVFCCETDQGKKVLAPFRGSAERAKFVREILCSMQEKGYPVEQVSLTKDGQCVVTDESGMRFWLKDLVEGKLPVPRRWQGFIAVFHPVLRKFRIL